MGHRPGGRDDEAAPGGHADFCALRLAAGGAFPSTSHFLICKLMQSLWRKSDLTIAACCCGAGLGTPNRGVEGGKLLSTGEAGEYNFIYDPEWFYSSDTARHR